MRHSVFQGLEGEGSRCSARLFWNEGCVTENLVTVIFRSEQTQTGTEEAEDTQQDFSQVLIWLFFYPYLKYTVIIKNAHVCFKESCLALPETLLVQSHGLFQKPSFSIVVLVQKEPRPITFPLLQRSREVTVLSTAAKPHQLVLAEFYTPPLQAV